VGNDYSRVIDSADWSWCCTWRAFGGAYRFYRGRGVRTPCDPPGSSSEDGRTDRQTEIITPTADHTSCSTIG